MKEELTRKNLRKRMLTDLLAGGVVIVVFVCAVYFSDLRNALAEGAGSWEFGELGVTIVILACFVWLLGIVLLRRVEEVGSVMMVRTRIQNRAYEAQKMESMARLAMGTAHDFNNLLMGITGYCEIALEAHGTDDEVQECLMEIKKSGDKAGLLAKRLMDFGKNKSNEPHTKLLDLNEVIRDLQSLLDHLVGKQVQLSTNIGSGICQIKADLTQIEEILVNLVLNAHDAMPNGGNLIISTSNGSLAEKNIAEFRDGNTNGYIKLSVKDTGTGIDIATQERIFDPFFTTKVKGTGLGLFMVSGIVKRNGGYVRLHSEPGQGTTFEVYLPKAKA